jgi:hypothetical protein
VVFTTVDLLALQQQVAVQVVVLQLMELPELQILAAAVVVVATVVLTDLPEALELLSYVTQSITQ